MLTFSPVRERDGKGHPGNLAGFHSWGKMQVYGGMGFAGIAASQTHRGAPNRDRPGYGTIRWVAWRPCAGCGAGAGSCDIGSG
jgi:hypothetical protein